MNGFVPTYRLYGEETGQSGQFLLHCETIPERSRLHGWEIRPHRHRAFFQMLYISDGTGDVLTEGVYRRFDPGTLIFVPPECVHGFRFSRDVGGLVVTVRRERLDVLARSGPHLAGFAATTRILADASSRAPSAVDALRRVASEMGGRAMGRVMLAEALVAIALIDLARTCGLPEERAGYGERDLGRIEHLTSLIDAHFRDHHPASFYARRIGISAAHLNRIARARLGRSLQELIAERLMEEARRSLVFTFVPVRSIAADLGFHDPAYFSRFFSKRAGVSPATYRARVSDTQPS